MAFNSPTFLFLFLPVFLVLYFLAARRYKNDVALAASLIFFSWGQWFYIPLMVFVIAVNFILGRKIEQRRDQTPGALRFLWVGIVLDIVLLLFFKTMVAYGLSALQKNASGPFLTEFVRYLKIAPIPLGFSYVTFQLVAYLIDIYNEVTDSEKNFLNFSLYILLFPKIITGPIARYRDIGAQLEQREITIADAANGARRFIIGLAKKALIADQLARIVNPAFALPTPSFTTGIAWLVLVSYALQLYFDFSGYTDMAIGLAQMLGFRFPENFNYPYISRSISEFWRRWHISLSTWFRDYVFYPLEFTRRRASRFRQQLHIFIVFLLTGFWHGLTINFILWGILHGLALALEMTQFGRWLKKTWRPVSHIYTLVIILAGWVFFRSQTLAFAGQFFARLAGWQAGGKANPLPGLDVAFWAAFVLAVFFTFPVLPAVQAWWKKVREEHPSAVLPATVSYYLAMILLLISSLTVTLSTDLVATIYSGF